MCVLYSYNIYIYIIICINIHPPFKLLMFWNIAYIIIYPFTSEDDYKYSFPIRSTTNRLVESAPRLLGRASAGTAGAGTGGAGSGGRIHRARWGWESSTFRTPRIWGDLTPNWIKYTHSRFFSSLNQWSQQICQAGSWFSIVPVYFFGGAF